MIDYTWWLNFFGIYDADNQFFKYLEINRKKCTIFEFLKKKHGFFQSVKFLFLTFKTILQEG